jgi:hypothetical protein
MRRMNSMDTMDNDGRMKGGEPMDNRDFFSSGIRIPVWRGSVLHRVRMPQQVFERVFCPGL